MRFIRSTDTPIPPWMASDPPDFPVRAAIGTTGDRWREAMAKTARTSSADSTFTTSPGGKTPRSDSSLPYSASRSASSTSRSAGKAARSSRDGLRHPRPRHHPNTSTSLPLIASGASAAHQPTTRATSSASMAGGNGVCASMRVSTPPGETVITWTPEPRTSSARLFAKPTSPHFEAL